MRPEPVLPLSLANPPLLTIPTLERSEVVANAAMNRERGLGGVNSYAQDLGFDPLAFLLDRLVHQPTAAWLDLCCGAGRALVEAAELVEAAGLADRIAIVGLDLVPLFHSAAADHACLRVFAASVSEALPTGPFDFITCVHGLHYVGDKLDVLRRAAASLAPSGRLRAHLDLQNLRLRGAEPAAARRAFGKALRVAGFLYDARRGLLMREGGALAGVTGTEGAFPFRWLGANDASGPNRTGQPAIDSWYGPAGERVAA